MGVDESGIGYGNLSLRSNELGFFITASQTASYPLLSPQQICWITRWNIEQNFIQAVGILAPSSESLTHCAIYQSCYQAHAIIHIHQQKFWEIESPYLAYTPLGENCGTSSLAQSIIQLFSKVHSSSILGINMRGHRSGLIFWGKDLWEAYQKIILFEKLSIKL
ncbi:MAG: class II aldolase/adducin family protein [Bacteroidia bacterium]|nr:class II aldolase/adducin family protein [Bacteroidia bacterium]